MTPSLYVSPSTLEVERHTIGEVDLVVARGGVDLGTALRLSSELNDAVWRGAGPVVVDLCAVPFMDSTGLHLLLNALRRLTRQGRKLAIACQEPAVLRVFEATRLDGTFAILPTREEALAAV